jgi:hypothetical protein
MKTLQHAESLSGLTPGPEQRDEISAAAAIGRSFDEHRCPAGRGQARRGRDSTDSHADHQGAARRVLIMLRYY